jgi:hypothetical protein
MANSDLPRRLLQEHKRWADRFAMAYIVFTVCLFVGSAVLLDSLDATSDVRLAALLLLGIIVIVHAIWMAAGVAVAHLNEIVASTNLRPDVG